MAKNLLTTSLLFIAFGLQTMQAQNSLPTPASIKATNQDGYQLRIEAANDTSSTKTNDRLNVSFFEAISGAGTTSSQLTRMFVGETIKVKIELKNEQNEPFEGQYGIAFGDWRSAQKIPYILYQSPELQIPAGGTLTDTITTNQLPDITDAYINHVFPIIKKKGGEWTVDATKDLSFEYWSASNLLTDNIAVSKSKVKRNEPFVVYAPIKNIYDKYKRQYVVALFAEGYFRSDLVEVISREQVGDYFHCSISDFVSPNSNYKIVVVREDSPRIVISNGNTDYYHGYEPYIPASGFGNNFTWKTSIELTEDINAHNLKLTTSLSEPVFTSSDSFETTFTCVSEGPKPQTNSIHMVALDTDSVEHFIEGYSRYSWRPSRGNKIDYLARCTTTGLPPGTYKIYPKARIIDMPISVNAQRIEGINDTIVDYAIINIAQRSTTGIEDPAEATQVNIYPNPVVDVLTIESPEQDVQAVELFDSMGKLVWKTQNVESGVTIPMNDYSKGLYILHLKTANGKSVHKIKKN